MTNECVFCAVVRGEKDAAVVHQDDHVMAIVDPRQSHEGHVLVIPREHVETIDQVPPHVAGPLMTMVATISGAVQRAIQPQGISLWQSNGTAAGQEVPHVHIHVFPRWQDDGHLAIYPRRVENTALPRRLEIAAAIAAHLG